MACETFWRFGPRRDQSHHDDMTRDAAELVREALRLSVEARSALADSLPGGLDSEVDSDAEAAWQVNHQSTMAQFSSP
jgi:hypothetical protein